MLKRNIFFPTIIIFGDSLVFLRCKSQIFLESFIIFHQLLWKKLVGGFNPYEKYSSNCIISPRIGVKIKNMEETTTQQRSAPFPYSSLYLLGWKLYDESSPSPGIRTTAFPASSWQVLRDQLLSWAFAVYFKMWLHISHVVEFWNHGTLWWLSVFYVLDSGMHQIHQKSSWQRSFQCFFCWRFPRNVSILNPVFGHFFCCNFTARLTDLVKENSSDSSGPSKVESWDVFCWIKKLYTWSKGPSQWHICKSSCFICFICIQWKKYCGYSLFPKWKKNKEIWNLKKSLFFHPTNIRWEMASSSSSNLSVGFQPTIVPLYESPETWISGVIDGLIYGQLVL